MNQLLTIVIESVTYKIDRNNVASELVTYDYHRIIYKIPGVGILSNNIRSQGGILSIDRRIDSGRPTVYQRFARDLTYVILRAKSAD